MTVAAFDFIEAIADAVMFEGYVLYPYRASAMKNRFRWQFGVLVPRIAGESSGEPSHAQTECLVECRKEAAVSVKVRCLHLQKRSIEAWVDASKGWRACERVTLDGGELVAWDEATIETIMSPPLPLVALAEQAYSLPFEFAATAQREVVCHGNGAPAARVTRERWRISGSVLVVSERVRADLMKVRVRIDNMTEPAFAGDDRGAALRQSLLGCHTLLHVQDGQFVSVIDPPDDLAAIAKSCVNEYTWPVLGGPAGTRDLVLSAPIILYDHPLIAPESRDHFFDATEIDEMLALRVQTMTDEEKREAAATDAHARRIVHRIGDAGDAALHGAIRSFEELLNAPMTPDGPPFVEINCARVTSGSKVYLQPHKRSDSMDMFLRGRIATVAAVHRDLENRIYLAVTIDGDPGADLHGAYGRFFYFFPEEVQPLAGELR
jgi:hypothetical protein